MIPTLYWLPPQPDWGRRIAELEGRERVAWGELGALANAPLDFIKTERLNKLLLRRFAQPPPDPATRPVRLALLGSSTLGRLHAGIRVAALRRGLWVSTYEAEYGQYLQELLDPDSGLHRFRPDTVLLALDARHLAGGLETGMDAAGAAAGLETVLAKLRQCWAIARDSLGATVLQQTVLPVFHPLLGHNEQRLPDSPERFVARLNAALREAADREGVHLLALDARAAQDGVRVWHDPVLWHRAK